jgi:hypothetical protein
MKAIIYFGETNDFSDKQLLSWVGEKYKVITITPKKKKIPLAYRNINLGINRLYTSAIDRYGEEKISGIVEKIRKLEKQRIPIINSSDGYLLDLNRKKQFDFFSSERLPFAPVLEIKNIILKRGKIPFPYVVKINPSGRNRKLLIVRNQKEISNLPAFIKQVGILQPLINHPICYRTEFVGEWQTTFPQQIKIQENKLYFRPVQKIIPTPLSEKLIKKILNTLAKVGIQIFSIEYFMVKGKPIIVDFNLTSNYQRFFIAQTKDQLKKAWLNLIKGKIQ